MLQQFRKIFLLFAAVLAGSLIIAACGSGSDGSTSGAGEETEDQKVAGSGPAASELGSIDAWYNSEPTTLAALQGNPVLLVFWADY